MKTRASCLAFLLLTTPFLRAQTVTWDGGGDGVSWHDPLNWSGNTVPTGTNDVLIAAGSATNVYYQGSQPAVRSLINYATIWLRGGASGSATLSVSGDLTNHGTIRLQTVAGSWDDSLNVNGTLVNATDGVLEVNPGTGGGRYLTANVLNQGVCNIASGTDLYANGTSKTFRQEAGSINATNLFTWAGGRFDFVGGLLTGSVAVRSGSLEVAVTAGDSTIICAENSTLLANRASNVVVWVRGGLYGHAVLTTADEAINVGAIRLETSAGGWDSILNVAGSNLVNTASGNISSRPGTGGDRSINGYLVNQGVVDATGHYVNLTGTYEAAGGRILGGGRLVGGQLKVTASPATPTTIDLWATTTLLTDVLPNTELWVHGGGSGNATLTSAGNVTNYGTIRLETAAGGWDDALNVAGVLVNAPAGVLQVNPGSGGARTFSGNLVNQGVINVAAGTGLYASGAGKTFRQEGSVIANGFWTWADGLFDFAAGSLQGYVWVFNGSLRIRDTVTSDSTVSAGGTTTLLANESTTVRIWVHGSGSYSHATLAADTNAVNAGRILMQSTDGGYRSVLTTTAAGLVNKPTGIIEAAGGSGGDRYCSGWLVNQGTVLATNGGFFSFYGTYQADGGTMNGAAGLINGQVRVTRSPPAATTIPLLGANTLTTDNLTNIILWVQGGGSSHGLLTAPSGFVNHGTIRLQSVNGGYNSDLVVSTGILHNATSGVLEINTGTGGPRNLTASLDNEGTLAVESGISLYCHGTNRIWNQLGGNVSAAGACTWADGAFNLSGGDISGTLYLRDATVDVAVTATHSNTVIATANCTLLNSRSSQTTIWVCGGPYSHATLSTSTNGSLNLGIIRLESRNGGYTSALSASGVGLTNGPTGVISSGTGTGGNRWLSGTLVNQGLVDATGYYLDVGGSIEESGGRFEGSVRIRDSLLRVTASPTAPTTMLLWHVNTLISDNLTNVTLLVQGGGDGHATLNWTNGGNNFGTLALDSINGGYSATLNLSSGTLRNRAGGAIEFRPGTGGGRPVNARLTNDGEVRANANASFSATSANHSSSGTIRLANATLTFSGATFTNLPGAVLAGSGTFDVSGVTFHNAGRLSPGASAGRLIFSGTMSESETAQLDLEIGGPTTATDFDQVTVTGAAELAGTVNITMTNGYVPLATNVFPVVTYGSLAGGFTAFNGLAIDATHIFEPFYKPTQLELRLLANTNLPSILVPPASQSVAQGNPVQFQVTANGTPPLNYQWRFKGGDLLGETRNTLAFVSAQTNLTGGYSVVVANSAGAVTSAVATLIVTMPSQVVYWDGGGDGTNWSDPINWSGDFVPGATNDVIADVATLVTITVTNNVTIRSLQCEEALLVSGGTFAVTSGASWVNGGLTVNANRSLTARGSNVTFTANGPTSVDSALLTAQDGANLNLPMARSFASGWLTLSNNSTASMAGLTNVNLTRFFLYAGSTFTLPSSVTSYSSSCSMGINEQRTVMSVNGAGSRLDLSSLKSFEAEFDFFGALRQLFVATAGGELDLSGVTVIRGGGSGVNGGGPLEFRTDATGSIRLDALTQLTGTGAGILINLVQAHTDLPQLVGASTTQFQLPAGGELAAPLLASLQSCRLTIPSAARFAAPSLAVFNNCTLDLSGSGLFQSGPLTTVDMSRFFLSAGATYTLPPQISSFSSSGGFGANEQRTLLSATGTGTRLDFSSLTNIEGIFSGFGGLRLLVTASSGAVIDLSGLRTIAGGGSGVNGGGPFEFRSDDTGTVLLPALERVSGSGAGVLINLAGTNTLGASQLVLTNAELTLPTNSLVAVGALQLGPDGDLSGIGVLQGDVLNAGFVRPGSSAGRLTILGNYTQAVTGTFVAEVGGPNAGTQYDQFLVSSNAVLGGTLDLRLINSYAPNLTNRFQILACGSLTGVFDNLVGADAGQSVTFAPAYETNAVWLNLAFATGPSVIAASPSGIIGDTFDRFILTFSETLLSSSFTAADIALTGPAGTIAVNAPQLLSNTTWQVTFAAQTLPGNYTLTLGPAITDLVGNAMNQNGDTLNGQALDDRFVRTVSVPPPVDFISTAIASPLTAAVGTPVLLSWTVLNQSTNPATGPRTDAVYLSADNKVGSDVLLGQFTTPDGLAAGEARAVTNSVLLPVGTSGSRYFIVVADSSREWFETNETNNTFVSTNTTIVSAADLTVTSVTSSKSSAKFGESLTVTWVVRNGGSATAATTWRDRVYLSPTTSVTAQSIVLPPDATGGPLAVGASYTNQATVTLPLKTDVSAGTYYLVVAADVNDTQAEASEVNNTASRSIALTLPPLPDLLTENVQASYTSIQPGTPIEVTADIVNTGAASVSNGFSVVAWLLPDGGLSPTNVQDRLSSGTLVGLAFITNTVPAGGSIQHTQKVTIPVTGPAGDLRVVLQVDAYDDVFEQAETNNLTLAANKLTVPLALSLAIPVTNVLENTSAPDLPCQVMRNGDLSAPLPVSLASSAADRLLVPASVTIPAGAAATPFTARVLHDGVPGPDVWATLTAQAGGFLTATSAVFVVNADSPRLALSLAKPEVLQGYTVLATVSSDPPSSQPLVVSIASSSPGRLLAPDSVTIPTKAASAAFNLVAVDSTALEPPQVVTVTVTAPGYAGASTNITVLNAHIPTLTLSLDRTNISEGDGPLAAVATVSRLPFADQPLTLALASSNLAAATVPARITIPAMEGSASFYVGAVDDQVATAAKVTLLTAQALDVSGNPVGTQAEQLLTVQDDDGPTLRLQITSKVVGKNLNPATTATVGRNTPSTNALVVQLWSSATSLVTLPATVTIPAGQTNATFTIVSLDDGATNTSRTVLITASAVGFNSGSDQLLITDSALPDLVIPSVTVPVAGYVGESVLVAFRMVNQGRGPLTNGVSQSVYLAPDGPVVGGTSVGTVFFAGPLAAGQYVDQTLVIAGSALTESGSYRLWVTADASDSAAEINEANNTSVGRTPLAISAGYFATVKAGMTNVLAGTPVPLSGTATLMAGGPAANKPVNILVTVRGFQRVLDVMTDTNGQFSTVFTALPNEAGRYAVAAAFPGVTQAPAQDQFTILGLTAAPADVTLRVVEGGHAAATVAVQNLGEVPLSGLTATISGLPANLLADVLLSTNSLAGLGTMTLSCAVAATDATIRQSAFTIHLASLEGATIDLPAEVSVLPLQPQLGSVPARLSAAMLRGGQTIVQFDVVNLGGAATGPLIVNVPVASWLSVASTNPLPSLEPGTSNRVTLVLTPAAGLPLGPYTGMLALNAPTASATVGFEFLCVSDLKGDLRVTAVDEYTYYAQGTPNVTNATVRVTDAATGVLVAMTNAGPRGIVLLTNLTEAYYVVEVSAEDHNTSKDTILVQAGQMNELTAFMPRQTVKYYWTVEPTQLTDRTRLTVTTVFETVVPAPVVTIEPNLIDLAEVTSSTQIDLKISNHGLIAAKSAQLSFEQHADWAFTLLTSDLGDLPGLSSRTVPLLITRSSAKRGGGSGCSVQGTLAYKLNCGGQERSYGVSVAAENAASGCGGGGVIPASAGGSGDGAILFPASSSGSGGQTACNDCAWEFLKWFYGCVWSVWPFSGLPACFSGVQTLYFASDRAWDDPILYTMTTEATLNFVDCFAKTASGGIGLGQMVGMFNCAYGLYELNNKCGTGANGAGIALHSTGEPGKRLSLNATVEELAPLQVQFERLAAIVAPLTNFFGDPVWLNCSDPGAMSNWVSTFWVLAQTNSDAGYRVTTTEQAQLLALPMCPPVTTNDAIRFLERWNRTVDYAALHIFRSSQVPLGWNTDFLALDVATNLLLKANTAMAALVAEGYDDPILAVQQTAGDLLARITRSSGGICARVRLQLDQEAVLSRDAFKATLVIDNTTSNLLTNVSIQLVVRDTSGRDTTSLFGIGVPEMSGLSAVDGTGVIGAQSTGKAVWTLIPTSEAAPTQTTEHVVSGVLQYQQNGTTVTIPLAPMSINVLPNPSLTVLYFHQRDVFADDPFTWQIEPAVPYSLAVMVQNHGYGTAHNLQIASAQPKIIENEKGLVIDFKIIGTQVGSQSVTPSLTVDFGDLGPGQTKIGRWLLTSTLQGLFTEYEATFEQVSDLGDQRLSLFDSVEIHQLTRLVQTEGSSDDGLPDFLVNDVADVNSLPDTLYLSDGRIQPVSVIRSATTDGAASTTHLQVQFTATFPSGFSYVRVPDPGKGDFQLQSVTRGNGSQVHVENYWTTDRTFIGLGQRPINEYNLHLFDFHTNAGPETYTLVYTAPSSVPQTNPPASAVFALSPQSPPSFGVAWNGQNAVGQAGVAFYDIFVSDNAGPFMLWQPRTTATSALFSGSPGHTYAFYSLATDTAGNVEAPPTTPDATTVVTLTNSPPSIVFGGAVVVNEGETARVTPTVSDPDLPSQTFTFRLLENARPGVVVDPASGQLKWPTGPGSGPSTNVFGVVVTDNGFPPLSATGFATVIIQQVLRPLILAAIADYTINEGFRLIITNVVTDYNTPKRAYVFSLVAGAPTGASINPTNGVFTWTPSSVQGPSTNLLTVVVTDSSEPTLGATQNFTVVVRDVMPDLVLSLGSTNLMAGESASVPLNLASTLDVVSLNLQFSSKPERLTDFALQPVAAEVASATLQSLGSNSWAASLTLNPALRTATARPLARLAFLASSDAHSAIVPVMLTQVQAIRLGGGAVTNLAVQHGQVIVVEHEPVLVLSRAPSPTLTLLGMPGRSYALLAATNLDTGTVWPEFQRLTLNGRTTNLPGMLLPAAPRFIRALEVAANAPRLALLHLDRNVFALRLEGISGQSYTVQSATAVTEEWSNMTSIVLTNTAGTLFWTNGTETQRYFRTRTP